MDFIKTTLNQVNTQENTLYDFIYNLFFYVALIESSTDIKNCRVMTISESKERLVNEYKNLHIS